MHKPTIFMLTRMSTYPLQIPTMLVFRSRIKWVGFQWILNYMQVTRVLFPKVAKHKQACERHSIFLKADHSIDNEIDYKQLFNLIQILSQMRIPAVSCCIPYLPQFQLTYLAFFSSVTIICNISFLQQGQLHFNAQPCIPNLIKILAIFPIVSYTWC